MAKEGRNKRAEFMATRLALEEEQSFKYPWFWRLFGILSLVGSGLQIVLFVFNAILIIRNEAKLPNIEGIDKTTLVITIFSLVVSAALTLGFLVLGIRLLCGRRRKAAFLAIIMIALEVASLLFSIMLTGIDYQLLPTLVNIVILIALQSYADPTLVEERRVQHNLRDLEVRDRAEDGTLGRDLSGKGFIELNFFNLFWVFVICGFFGLLIETVYHFAVVDPGVYQDRAGMLYGPFSPIYGFGAVLLTLALNRFHNRSLIIIFFVSAVVGGAFEYVVSWFMEFAFGAVAWDYTGTFLSIDGRTNGMFMCMWGVLGMVWIKLALPAMLKLVNMIPWNWRYTVTTVCAALMIVDGGLTLASLDCWYERQSKTMDYSNASAIEQFCNNHYDNAFMAKRFQSMSIESDKAVRVS